MPRIHSLFGVAVVFLTAAALTAGNADGNLTGTYACKGVNPDGTSYQGVVQIAKHNDGYQMLWTIESQPAAVGVAIRSGDVLAAAYYSKEPGVVAYRIKEGTLVGDWTVAGGGGRLFSETLTKLSDEVSKPLRVPTSTRRGRTVAWNGAAAPVPPARALGV
jgi:hypothetical protein